MFARLPRIAFALAVTCLLMGRLADAKELQWDPSVYESLAPADSSDTIALGTKITLQNWES
jgi:hypothetical protein